MLCLLFLHLWRRSGLVQSTTDTAHAATADKASREGVQILGFLLFCGVIQGVEEGLSVALVAALRVVKHTHGCGLQNLLSGLCRALNAACADTLDEGSLNHTFIAQKAVNHGLLERLSHVVRQDLLEDRHRSQRI